MTHLNTPFAGRRLIEELLGRRAARALRRLLQDRPVFARLDALPEDRARVLAAYDRRCAYCQAAGAAGHELGVDHLVPASRGGTSHPENLVAACEACKGARREKHLDAFLQRRLDLDPHAVYARIARATARLRSGAKIERSAA